MTDDRNDECHHGLSFSRRRFLATAGATTLSGLTGCSNDSVNSDRTTDPATTEQETFTTTTTPTTATTTSEGGASNPTTTTSTTSPTNCENLDAIPFNLSVGFKPTISSVTPVSLSFCVDGVEWVKPGEEEDYPDYLAPADKTSDCFDLAPNEETDPVWKQWGLLPCTYESLRVGIHGCVECFKFDDGHDDHSTHSGETKNARLRWDLGPPDENLDVDPGDELDITVYVDIAEDDGSREFKLEPNDVTVRSK